jgi:hypothetical protein
VSRPGFDQDIVATAFVEQIDVRSGSVRIGFEVRTRRADKAAAVEEGIRRVVSARPGVEQDSIRRSLRRHSMKRASATIAAVVESTKREQRHWELPGRVAANTRKADSFEMTSLIMSRQKARSAVLSVSLLYICLGSFLAHSPAAAAPASAREGEQIFVEKCTACHTIGKGRLVGPDLSGVTTRREESWHKRDPPPV